MRGGGLPTHMGHLRGPSHKSLKWMEVIRPAVTARGCGLENASFFGNAAQWVECLPGVHKAPGLISSTAYTGCEDAFPVIPVFTKQRRENQFGVILDYSTVSSIKASLGYKFVKGEGRHSYVVSHIRSIFW